jgi:hypothetical protein
MTEPEDLQELCKAAKEWVASPDGQKIIQESLAKAQELTEKLDRAMNVTNCDWQRVPFRKEAIAQCP